MLRILSVTQRAVSVLPDGPITSAFTTDPDGATTIPMLRFLPLPSLGQLCHFGSAVVICCLNIWGVSRATGDKSNAGAFVIFASAFLGTTFSMAPGAAVVGFEVVATTVPESTGFRTTERDGVSTGLGLSPVAVTTTGALTGVTVRTGTATCCPSSRIGDGCEGADTTRALSGCDGTVG